MARQPQTARTPLSREGVLRAGVAMADADGLESLSMRKLARELGVDPMSLYNHVANKDDLLGGMVDLVIDEIDLTEANAADWKAALRARVLAARKTMLQHPWARFVVESRTDSSPTITRYYEAIASIFRSGGVSLDLVHHALHTLGSRLLGFSQELFDDSSAFDQGPEVVALMAHQMAGAFPNLSEMMLKMSHDEATVVGSGCDDQSEFEFALDLILDGLERHHNAASQTASARGVAVRRRASRASPKR
jgi:AcrR family transcriptional regulator